MPVDFSKILENQTVIFSAIYGILAYYTVLSTAL